MTNESQFTDYVEKNLSRRHDIGFSKVLSLSDKENLVRALVEDSVLHTPGLYQLIEGRYHDQLELPA